MRLTLRTMLAYMDEVLEPADAEILSKKIEESDFASGLVDRIRGVLRKLRMDAPRLDGKGMGNDANTVAEYLDSTLPQDRVAEFERVCLESDKHLCEVAACHQILALVLGKPADVPPQLRERIYALTHGAAPGVSPPAVGAGALMPPPVTRASGQSAEAAPLEVPEYLRSGRQPRIWPLLLVAAATLLVALGILRAFGPFDRTHPLAKMMQTNRPGTAAVNGELTAKTEPSGNSAPEQPAATKSDSTKSPESSTIVAAIPAPAAPPDATSTTTATPSPPLTDAPPAQQPATLPADGVAAAPVPAASAATEAPTTEASPTPPVPAVAVTPAPTPESTPPAPATATPEAARPPMEVGRYTSDAQLIATLDASDGFWYPKQPQEILVAGERMVVLPPFRPQIALPSAVTLTFAGEGSLQMGEPSDNPVLRVAVHYGRFLAATAGRPGAQVELDLAGVRGVLTLVDADTVMAIKVLRWLPPGSDPETTDRISVVEMYNANGRATWQPTEQEKIEIPARHVHVHYGTEPPETHGPFLPPEWIDSKSVRSIDRDAGVTLERLINQERPLNLTLEEVMKDRRVEMRALAARCLVALDEFDPALEELADPNQYSFWMGQFEALKQALSRSKESATKLKETISLLRPAHAKELYRMFWGYSEDQLAMGGAAELVRFLEHDQIDVRVVAHLSLVSITGARESYRPERLPAQMRTAIQSWRDRLMRGAIIYQRPPSPLDTYKPAPPPAGAELRPGAPAPGTPAATPAPR